MNTSDVVTTTVAGLDEKIKSLETEFESIKNSVDILNNDYDSSSGRYSMAMTDVLERIASLRLMNNRVVERVNSVRDNSVQKSEFEGLEERVNNLDSTDSNSLSSKMYALEEKVNNFSIIEDRVNALVRSNILLEERLRPF